MNNKVKFLRGTATEYEASTKDNDTFYYTTDTKKLYLGENEVGNGIDPKVIQAHIDNQTIHAKVWRGTQEEYNAIDPKEDDTVYIIKDSDNTLADKLIDDTSTTATDKTWSAKKINENDEVARAAVNTHAGNAEIHVTAEEKAAWNAVNYSNPNLLDNPDFKINQRGLSVYSQSSKGSKMSIDRWFIYKDSSTATGDVTLTPSSSGGLVLNNQTGGKAAMYQRIENFSDLFGKQVTYSASINGSILSLTAICTNTTSQIGDVIFTDDKSAYLRITALLNTRIQFEIYLNDGTSITVDWAKVEIGSIATPFCPPDPATELAKCQRYYQIRSTGDIAPVDLRPTMRDTPTITQLSDGNYAYSAEL